MKGNVIGVTPLYCDEKKSIWMLPGYLDMLRAAGLVPVILPDIATEEELHRLDQFCDGYLFTGGHDVDPALYDAVPSSLCGSINHNRDHLEERLFRIALASDKPILGICRGIQLINVLLGGTCIRVWTRSTPPLWSTTCCLPTTGRYTGSPWNQASCQA